MIIISCINSLTQIKPRVGTVCFGVAASQGALLLAGGQSGMRYAMPNARIMIHQPQSGCGVCAELFMDIYFGRRYYILEKEKNTNSACVQAEIGNVKSESGRG